MPADATVYGISLVAVGKAASAKRRAASISGVLQIILAFGVAAELVRRLLFGSEPEGPLMIFVSSVALIANVACPAIISKHKDGEVHMRASWLFSRNDVIANVEVIMPGILVYALASPIPDPAIGAIIAVVVLRGGMTIVLDAKNEKAR